MTSLKVMTESAAVLVSGVEANDSPSPPLARRYQELKTHATRQICYRNLSIRFGSSTKTMDPSCQSNYRSYRQASHPSPLWSHLVDQGEGKGKPKAQRLTADADEFLVGAGVEDLELFRVERGFGSEGELAEIALL